MSIQIDVNRIQDSHPQIRAEDFRSPLVRRLIKSDLYKDGSQTVIASFAGAANGSPVLGTVTFSWSDLTIDFNKMVKTYQAPVITELATLGLACSLVTSYTVYAITEVTRRGEKADYWIGNKELMLEVSGQEDGDIGILCAAKSGQLQDNPFHKDGYVCVANYGQSQARLWYYAAPPTGDS